jgi:hypothetical protein
MYGRSLQALAWCTIALYLFKLRNENGGGGGLWYLTSLSIMAVSVIGGGNRSTWRNPLTSRKSLTNFIT